jgi:hypothetical protein
VSDSYCPYCRRGQRRHKPCPPPHDFGAEIKAVFMSLSEDDPVRRAYEGKKT